ncbi:hypothetical protein ACIP8Z_34110 [Streptomyces sp. NPDC088553]|uniref:hypothetical protein n=1 Tax=Streptomyces sp. NPDC088553 TaxID=3365864 RepID=UPI00381F07E6
MAPRWASGLVECGHVSCPAARDEKTLVDRTNAQVKNLPEFHRDKHLGDSGYREEHGT